MARWWARIRSRRFLAAVFGVVLLVGLGLWTLWVTFPFPLAALAPGPSTVVVARNGVPLRFYLAPDESWRFPVRLGEIAPILPRVVLAAEDRHFRHHPGINPLSLVRAAWSNLRAGHVVSGGSTITMQLARLADPRPRTLRIKCFEAFRALQLERRLSKDAILEAYCNLAPYGGNLVGVGAASYFYFGKTPDRLSLAEAALLAVLPRSPVRLDPVRHPRAAKAVRDRLLADLARRRIVTDVAAREAMAAPLPASRRRPPCIAPHFCELVRSRAGPGARVATTLDPAAQQAVEHILRGRSSWLRAQGIGSVAAVVLDPANREVLALVGGTDFFGDPRFGQINGATIRRSPGSALKPFLYAMAMDQGRIFPQSQLLDIPTGFAGYNPKNYDGLYLGRVTVEQALVTSRNVPAVRLLDAVGTGPFLDLLRRGGLATLDKPAAHYGLSLVLGGGEVTLLSLVNLYADLASLGEHRPPRLLLGPPGAPGPPPGFFRPRPVPWSRKSWPSSNGPTCPPPGIGPWPCRPWPGRPAPPTATAMPGPWATAPTASSASGSATWTARRSRAFPGRFMPVRSCLSCFGPWRNTVPGWPCRRGSISPRSKSAPRAVNCRARIVRTASRCKSSRAEPGSGPAPYTGRCWSTRARACVWRVTACSPIRPRP